MADPRTEPEPGAEPGVPDPIPEEAARLLEAVRRALTPVGESGGSDEETRIRLVIERALELGLIERA